MSKHLIQTLPAAIGGNAQSNPGVCAIIVALFAFSGAFFGQNDFCFLMWNFHHA
jgi:hypothetical protein